MLTSLFYAFAFLIVILFVYMARYSGRLRVEETRLIAAPIAEVYARVADFREWNAWNPWLEHEPQVQIALSGDPAGRRGRYAWDSERIGSCEIENSILAHEERIKQRIVSRQPFKFHGNSRWTFVERDGKTEVTWAFSGRVGFALRAFAQTVRSTIMLDFRYGLDRLAKLVEPADCAEAATHYSLAYAGLREVDATRYVYRTYNGPLSGIGKAIDTGLAELLRELERNGKQPTDRPIAAYVKTNNKLRTTVCHFGYPMADAMADLPLRELPAHRAIVVRLTGRHSALEIAWYQAMQRLRIDGLKPDQRTPPFERYLNDPQDVPENERVTELHIPVLAAANTAIRQ